MMAGGSDMKTVCIVGGGPSGLVSLRRVLDSPMLTGRIFEQKDDIGGLWNYKGVKEFPTSPKNLSGGEGDVGNGSVEPDPEAITTMYDDLSCNLPYPLMEFRDFPHPDSQSTLLSQSEMHQYLRRYATHFNLWPNISLNTAVISIRPETPITNPGEPGRWIVQTHNHQDDAYETEIYDAVLICTGKNSYPYHPTIPGLETFTGNVFHFKYFKNAEANGVQGKDVVCVGLGPSAADLILSLSKTAKSVTLCHKFPFGLKLGLLPQNSREVQNIKMVTSDGVITEEDEVIPCQAIILCTGYALKYPFLDPECGISVVEEKYIPNLYNMTVFTKRPTLGILNLCYRAPEYFIIEVQARYFVSCLEGKTKLPPFHEMDSELAAQEEEKKALSRPYSTWFQVGEFGEGSWKLFAKIAEDLGLKSEYKHAPLLEQLYLAVVFRIFGKVALYKKDVFKVVDENTWELILHYSSVFPETKPEKVRFTLNSDATVKIETLEIFDTQ